MSISGAARRNPRRMRPSRSASAWNLTRIARPLQLRNQFGVRLSRLPVLRLCGALPFQQGRRRSLSGSPGKTQEHRALARVSRPDSSRPCSPPTFPRGRDRPGNRGIRGCPPTRYAPSIVVYVFLWHRAPNPMVTRLQLEGNSSGSGYIATGETAGRVMLDGGPLPCMNPLVTQIRSRMESVRIFLN